MCAVIPIDQPCRKTLSQRSKSQLLREADYLLQLADHYRNAAQVLTLLSTSELSALTAGSDELVNSAYKLECQAFALRMEAGE